MASLGRLTREIRAKNALAITLVVAALLAWPGVTAPDARVVTGSYEISDASDLGCGEKVLQHSCVEIKSMEVYVTVGMEDVTGLAVGATVVFRTSSGTLAAAQQVCTGEAHQLPPDAAYLEVVPDHFGSTSCPGLLPATSGTYTLTFV